MYRRSMEEIAEDIKEAQKVSWRLTLLPSRENAELAKSTEIGSTLPQSSSKVCTHLGHPKPGPSTSLALSTLSLEGTYGFWQRRGITPSWSRR